MSRFRLTVVAGLIEKEGLVLIGQRRKDDRHPLKWEFPGGKVEPGETAREALQRELEEELSIQAVIGAEVARYDYQYRTGSPLHLVFYRVDHYQGEPRNSEFNEIRWEVREALPAYDFLDGDRDFVQRLARREL